MVLEEVEVKGREVVHTSKSSREQFHKEKEKEYGRRKLKHY